MLRRLAAIAELLGNVNFFNFFFGENMLYTIQLQNENEFLKDNLWKHMVYKFHCTMWCITVDVLTDKDVEDVKGPCALCCCEFEQGKPLARLQCLCLYHLRYFLSSIVVLEVSSSLVL